THDEAPSLQEDTDLSDPDAAAQDPSDVIAPPEEEPATLADEPDGPDSDGLDAEADIELDDGPDPISTDPAADDATDAEAASAPEALPAVASGEGDEPATEGAAAPGDPEAGLDEPGVAVETPPSIGPDMLHEPSTPVESPPQLSIYEQSERPEPSVAPLSAEAPRAEEFAAAQVTGKRLYVVKRGESFFTITKKLFGTVRYFPAVQKANPDVDPRRLRPGQVIAIPAPAGATLREEFIATPEDMKPKPPRVYLERDTTHLIRPGETLEGISKKYYDRRQKWRHILRVNPGRIRSPKRLKPGIRIVIPALTE
ncbi:MAG: LysM peptidoglycan-binding domain-containing protein, partial [Planctomycetota bacterium]